MSIRAPAPTSARASSGPAFIAFRSNPALNLVSRPNKTTAAAKFILLAKGLTAKLQGQKFGIGARKVTGQNPGAGTKVPKGTEVTVYYKYTGAVLVKVNVPNTRESTLARVTMGR